MTQRGAHPRRRGVSRAKNAAAGALALVGLLTVPCCGGAGRSTTRRAAPRPQPAQFQNPPVDEPVTNYFPSSAPPASALATIRAHEKLTPIPRSYLGLSTEYWTLPTDELHVALYKRLLALVHVPGDGRFVLRIGGDSSDHAFWDPDIRRLPHWAFEVTPDFVERTAAIVRALRLRVIVDMNLITGTPLEAGAWAHAAEREMPNGSIMGFEIGNEPDLYDREDWLVNLGGTRFAAGLLPKALTPATYARDYDKYARVLRRVARHVPLIAPALANPQTDSDYISTLLAGPHPDLRMISVHRYPYSACSLPGEPTYPTIGRVLSEAASAGLAASVRPALRLARKAHLPLRLTEINSVTCGGLDAVSRRFATALWAPDAIFELIKVGAVAVNLHVRVFALNAPFRFTEGGVRARALLYGLILFTRMLGHHSRLVPVRLSSPPSLHLKAWAVRVSRHTLNVLLLNKGPRTVTVHLQLPGSGAAAVERMLAPAATSSGGVTLAGRRLGADARWRGARAVERVARGKQGYAVAVRGISAALVTVRVARGALA
jgi:hypothetical protein